MKYKTQNKLKEIWKQLDDACGLLDNATSNLSEFGNIPQEIKDELERFDIMEIVSLKNQVEELLDEDNL